MGNYPDYPVYHPADLADLLRYSAQKYGKRTAFQDGEKEYSYLFFEKAVLSVAGSLGDGEGRFLLLQVKHSLLFAIGFFATVLSGNIPVLLPPGQEGFGALTPPIALRLSDEWVRERMEEGGGAAFYESLPVRDPNGICAILYSSGTTSAVKGVMLSQRNLCTNACGGLEKYAFTEADRLVQLIPYYHAFGLVCDLLAPLLAGTRICILDEKEQFLSKLSYYQPTMLNAPPAVAKLLLKMAESVGSMEAVTGGRLRKMLCGGAGLEKGTADKLKKWGILALGCYGITECSPAVCVNRDAHYKLGSEGLPLNCCSVRIAEDGEIIVRGENVMLGYYGNPEQTAKCLINGEFHTGDLGRLDEDGFLFVIGRKGNMIVFEDGTKCVPEELERRITAHPGVEEALVYALPVDGVLRLCTKIYAPNPQGREEIERFVRGLPTHQPLYGVSFADGPLQRTATGKLVR